MRKFIDFITRYLYEITLIMAALTLILTGIIFYKDGQDVSEIILIHWSTILGTFALLPFSNFRPKEPLLLFVYISLVPNITIMFGFSVLTFFALWDDIGPSGLIFIFPMFYPLFIVPISTFIAGCTIILMKILKKKP